MSIKKEYWIYIALIIIVSILVLNSNKSTSKVVPVNTDYLSATEDFDVNSEIVQSTAKMLKGRNDMETLKNTETYVVNNIIYSDVSTNYCISDEKASTVIETKKGDCVSKTKAAVTLLRANGIQSRSVGGCLSRNNACSTLQGIIPITNIPTSSIKDNKKRGDLHEWYEAYIDGKWYQVEPTAYYIYPEQCNNYIKLSYDSNVYDRCVINDNQFVATCGSK